MTFFFPFRRIPCLMFFLSPQCLDIARCSLILQDLLIVQLDARFRYRGAPTPGRPRMRVGFSLSPLDVTPITFFEG